MILITVQERLFIIPAFEMNHVERLFKNFINTQKSTRLGAVFIWLNPHEVIQSRESKRVGAKWTKVGANENKCMRE